VQASLHGGWKTFLAILGDFSQIHRMKIMHTGDWHLGKRLERFDRMDEHTAVMEEICQIAEAEAVDAVLVAGDLYDTFNPPTEAVQLLYRTLKRLARDGRRPVIAIAGNHDSPDRIEAPDPLASECGIIFAGYPQTHVRPFQLPGGMEVTRSAPGFIEVRIPSSPSPLRIILAPYPSESRLRMDLGSENLEATIRELLQGRWAELAGQYCDGQGVNILLGHLFMVSQGEAAPDEHAEEEKSIGPASMVFTQNLPQGIQYAALGHIHSFLTMTGGPCPAVYSSSTLPFSFPKRGENADAGTRNVVIIEGEPGQALRYRPVRLSAGRKLYRRLFPSTEAALGWLRENPECFAEISIETEHYISAEERRQIMAAHQRVVGPIPVFRNQERKNEANPRAIDRSKAREDLFRDYFVHVKGVEASEEMIALFREVAGREVAE
jgi:exonuclease SbcD